MCRCWFRPIATAPIVAVDSTKHKYFRIRPATPEDIGKIGDGGIRDLYNAARRHARADGQSPLSPPSYAQWEAQMARQAVGDSAVQLLVAEGTQGQILGFIQANHRKDADFTTLNKLVVTPEAQGSGIGRKLLENVRSEAKRQGKKELHVSAEHGAGHASGFYQQLGFAVTHTRQSQGGLAVDELTLPINALSAGHSR